MKLTHYIYISAALAMLTACSKDVVEVEVPSPLPPVSPNYTVGELGNTIVLKAGISDGFRESMTRAVDGGHAAGINGGGHRLIATGAMMRLRVDGTWLGKGLANNLVSHPTTITIGEQTAASGNSSLHNKITTFDPQLYWDDYGTADPANMPSVSGNGREKGLTIYGAGVNKAGVDVPVIDGSADGKRWTNLAWNVGISTTSVIDQTSGWEQYDLITSNNIKVDSDGTYKFDDWKNDYNNGTSTASNLLVFTHAMSKITVKLTASDGFTDHKFATDPSVLLEGFYHTGTVDVDAKTSSHTSDTKNVKMYLATGGASSNTATFEALVFPGNVFAEDIQILTLSADGNVFKVTAKKLRQAISNAMALAVENPSQSNYPTNQGYGLLPGWNYKINILVKKTEIVVTATIVDWSEVEAEEVSPVISVNASYSGTGSGSNASFGSFSFYRSLNKDKEYSKDYSANGYYAPEGTPLGTLGSSDAWSFTNKLYWPNHNTHYFFRGVWPLTSVATDDVETRPHVKDSGDKQVIAIKNVAYLQNSYPSDLAIGMPTFTEANKMCSSEANHDPVDQSQYGICATSGKIALDFQYVMSQVEVELKTVTGNAKVNINSSTAVDIVNVYSEGEVCLGDRGIKASGSIGTYRLDKVTGDGNENKRCSAIVPQSLTFTTSGATTNLRFMITIINDDESADIYYADINPILKSGTTAKVAPNGKWESGVHYKYILTLSKTEIKVTATLADWVTVNASENVWF